MYIQDRRKQTRTQIHKCTHTCHEQLYNRQMWRGKKEDSFMHFSPCGEKLHRILMLFFSPVLDLSKDVLHFHSSGCVVALMSSWLMSKQSLSCSPEVQNYAKQKLSYVCMSLCMSFTKKQTKKQGVKQVPASLVEFYLREKSTDSLCFTVFIVWNVHIQFSLPFFIHLTAEHLGLIALEDE